MFYFVEDAALAIGALQELVSVAFELAWCTALLSRLCELLWEHVSVILSLLGVLLSMQRSRVSGLSDKGYVFFFSFDLWNKDFKMNERSLR